MTDDPGIRLHRKQFVVGPKPAPLGDDWLERRLQGGLWLSHCPDLPVELVQDADRQEWVLLGLASQTRSDMPDPVEQLATIASCAVPEAYEGWAGRWTLLGGGEVHLDATGQLPCHWFADDAGDVWASSSPAAVTIIAGLRERRRLELIYERGLSWVAPPLGAVRGGNRLLPSQILNVAVGGTRWRRLAVPREELGLGDGSSSAMDGFLTALGHGMSRLPAGVGKHLALTAGADSRLVLAAALAANVQVDLFTRRSARMSVADREIPPRLAAAVGLGHREVLPKPVDPARLALARAHTAGNVSDGDALPFVQGVRDGFRGIELGGQGFGAGKVKNRQFPEHIHDAVAVADRVSDHFGEPQSSANRAALALWLEAVVEQQREQHPSERVDWRDRFYLEQRTSGWQAAKEQLYDLHTHQRFFPINSARVLGLLLAIDPTIRSTGRHRTELIARADKRLLSEPFNPAGSEFPITRRLAHVLVVDRQGMIRRIAGRLSENR